MTGNDAAVMLGVILNKLDSIKRKIINEHVVNGKLDADNQYAVRIIASRERLINRIYQARYGDGEMARLAKLELRLPNEDRGDVFRWESKVHSVGWFGCRACDYEYQPMGGLQMRTGLNRLCVHCQDGVQHTTTVEGAKAVQEGLQAIEGLSCTYIGEEIAQRASCGDIGGVYRVYVCDKCGWADAVELGSEV